jgi:hypothetical protein
MNEKVQFVNNVPPIIPAWRMEFQLKNRQASIRETASTMAVKAQER